jgi:hypothetical protein
MADETFDGVALAIGIQSAFGNENTTTAALSGALVVGNGIILGDKNSGDAESGITIPNLSTIVREQAQIQGSFTQQADEFVRAVTEGLAITFPLKGNGATATPAADEAQPDAGIDVLYETAGLVGASGAATPDYKYTPRATAIYSTVKLWVADLSFVFMDCLVDSLVFEFTPGGNGLVTANFKVGSINAFADNGPGNFPTFTWGFQSSLAAPTVEGVGFANFGQTRGFENLTITIANAIEEFGDSNVVTTGIRQSQKDRVITVDGRIYLATADSDAAYANLINTSAPTDDLSFQLGTANTGGATQMNAALINVNNLQAKDIKYDRTGTAAVVELSGSKATATTAGSEFTLEYN